MKSRLMFQCKYTLPLKSFWSVIYSFSFFWDLNIQLGCIKLMNDSKDIHTVTKYFSVSELSIHCKIVKKMVFTKKLHSTTVFNVIIDVSQISILEWFFFKDHVTLKTSNTAKHFFKYIKIENYFKCILNKRIIIICISFNKKMFILFFFTEFWSNNCSLGENSFKNILF